MSNPLPHSETKENKNQRVQTDLNQEKFKPQCNDFQTHVSYRLGHILLLLNQHNRKIHVCIIQQEHTL